MKTTYFIATLVFGLVFLNCSGTAYPIAELSAGQPYEDYFSEDSNKGSMELKIKTNLSSNVEYSNIVLDIVKVEVRKQSEEEDDEEHENDAVEEHEEEEEWLELSVPPVKLDIIMFSRHQMAVTAGAYNLEPNTYDRIRITLGPDSSVTVDGVSYPLIVDGQEGEGDEHSTEAKNGKIKIKGTIQVERHRMAGVVLNFDPAKDIRRAGKKHSHEIRYQMKNEFRAKQVVMGTNFPLGPPNYNVLTNITLDKTEACIGEEILVDTSFVYPYGVPGEVTITVGNSSGASTVVVYYEAGLKYIPVTVSDRNHRAESVNIPVMIKDCVKPGILKIREVKNPSFSGKTFYVETPGMSGDITYTWDFGDGQSITTQSPMAKHSYQDRIQTSKLDNFIVSVTATDGSQTRTGMVSVSMVNPHFLAALYKGQYLLETGADSFLQKDNTNTLKASFKVSNPGNLSVSITGVTEKMYYCNQSTSPVISNKSPSNILGFSQLPAYQNFSGTLQLASVPAGICNVEYVITGVTLNGNVPVTASLYFGLKSDASKAQAKPVSSQKTEEIKKALKVLGYPKTITDQDIIRLKLEGKI